jgi:DNA-binding transcriptional LysR family regulator
VDIRQLRYFVTLAHMRHFTRAAAQLQIAQPALSQQIRQLERELGVMLVRREHRQVELTAPGEALLAHAERILTEMEHARAEMAEFAGLRRGRVLLGALQSVSGYWLCGVLARFHARYPGIELALREDGAEQLAQLLGAARLDLALLHVTSHTPPPYLTAAEVVTEPLFSEELVLIAAPDSPLARRDTVAFAELRDAAFVAFKPGGGLRRALMEASAVEGFTPHIACESGDLNTIRALVATGLGVTLVPRSVATAAGRAVAIVTITSPRLARTVVLTWRTDHVRSVAAEACLAFIRAVAEDRAIQEVPTGG